MNVDSRLDKIKDCLYRVAVKAIIIRDDRILLAEDNGNEGWSFPGGGIDHGEEIRQALPRELEEELGIAQSSITCDYNVVSVTTGHESDAVPRCNLYFFVSIGTADVIKTSELSRLQWFDLDDLESIDFDSSVGNIADVITLIKTM